MNPYFILDRTDFSWGDYGAILLHGMSAHLERTAAGEIQLERTGPFVPPISFPGISDIVVTTPFRKKLEASGLVGFSFRPVVKAHVVELNWHRWDRRAPEPKHYPSGGEPESYILGKAHSEAMSSLLGNLWEVVPASSARALRKKVDGSPLVSVSLVADSMGENDLFCADTVLYKFVSERARAWFQREAGEWTKFRPVAIEPG